MKAVADVIRQAVAAERERCAAIADGWTAWDGRENETPSMTAAGIADALRKGGQ